VAKKKIEILRRRWIGVVMTSSLVALSAWVYGQFAHDYPRHPYLSGWLLFVLMLSLTFFNLRKKVPFLRLGSVGLWLQIHVYIGFFTGFLFLAHSGFSWPHGGLNQIIAVCFLIVFVSGVIGLWMSREFPKRLTVAGFETPFERMPHVRRQLRSDAEELIVAGVEGQTSTVIADFYHQKLGHFFTRHENFWSHLQRSRTPQAVHASQFDEVQRYARKNEGELLRKLEDLVERKHLLDSQYALQWSLRLWLFFHIPFSYSLLILSIAHVVIVHSFSGSAS